MLAETETFTVYPLNNPLNLLKRRVTREEHKKMFILKRMMTKKEECENIFFGHSVRSHEKGDVGSVKGPPLYSDLRHPNRACPTRGG